MKKICIFLLMMSLFSCFVSACAPKKPKANMIQSQRRFAKYVEPQTRGTSPASIDLSEGPKLRYDATFGPNNINFDIKIVDPY